MILINYAYTIQTGSANSNIAKIKIVHKVFIEIKEAVRTNDCPNLIKFVMQIYYD